MKHINPLHQQFAMLQENPEHLQKMITFNKKKFPYLEYSTDDGLMFLAKLMLDTNFLSNLKSTPIISSYQFLQWAAKQTKKNVMFNERDFVFLIKMFGLHVQSIKRIYSFCVGNIPLPQEEEFHINSEIQVKQLEFYLSGVNKLTIVQAQTIESVYNKLLRDTREVELARIFAAAVKDGRGVGQAKEYIMTHYGVKEHEFVRIRLFAIEMGIFSSSRKKAESARRVTIDDELTEYIDHLRISTAPNKNKPLTPSQAVNQALKYLRKLTTELSQQSSESGDVKRYSMTK